MIRIIKCTPAKYQMLIAIWERSVRATHKFLPGEVIDGIKQDLATDYLPMVDIYVLEADGVLSGFIGLSGCKIEMLFIDTDCIGKGYGSMLIDYAKQHGAYLVDVNEQNETAMNFYIAKGFKIISRDEKDEAGRPFPILHMTL